MLTLTNVTKQYDSFTLDCSLSVPKGQITGLIGKNGAGKSTTFKAILNLIHIDSGTIQLFGKEVSTLSKHDKEAIGVTLSDSMFSDYLCINDIAAMSKYLYQKFQPNEFLGKCQAQNLPLNQKISTFSTGTKAKLMLLYALSHNASFLILDEPTAGLDVLAREEMLDLLRNYMEEDNNRSILISSHIANDLEGLCDDIYMIDEGKVILHEDTDVLLSDYAILKVDEKQYESLDKTYLLRVHKENYGYSCLCNQKQFYWDNYKDIIIEKSSIDAIITMMIKGEKL